MLGVLASHLYGIKVLTKATVIPRIYVQYDENVVVPAIPIMWLKGLWSSVADPGRLDADPDPTFQADADPDPKFF